MDDTLCAHRIERLPWDSDHYGIAVARLNEPAPSPTELEASVGAARKCGIRLLYWLASPDAEIHDRLVARLGGKRISGRLVYHRELEETGEDGLDEIEGFRVEVYGGARSSGRLRNLAIKAGIYSRFRVDDRLPIGKFEEMYEAWVEKVGDRRARGRGPGGHGPRRRSGRICFLQGARRGCGDRSRQCRFEQSRARCCFWIAATSAPSNGQTRGAIRERRDASRE